VSIICISLCVVGAFGMLRLIVTTLSGIITEVFNLESYKCLHQSSEDSESQFCKFSALWVLCDVLCRVSA
jgi:hypothetical protein